MVQTADSLLLGSTAEPDAPLKPWLKPPVGEKFSGRPVWACPGIVLYATSGGALTLALTLTFTLTLILTLTLTLPLTLTRCVPLRQATPAARSRTEPR